MTRLRNDYANTLTEKRILYMPSCIIVEMLTKLYGQVATINLSGNLHNVTPDLLILLRRMQHNLRVTAEAYEQSRIRFFLGDWRDDKLRARKLFFNIMSRLGYVSELLEHVERNMLFAAIEGMTAEWTALDRIMDAKAEGDGGGGACAACRYFRDCNTETWKQTMADIVLGLDGEADYGEADHLILLCYGRVKQFLLSAIKDIERRNGTPGKFNPDRIAVVSKENVRMSCPKCSAMTASIRKDGTQVIEDHYPYSAYAGDAAGKHGASSPPRRRPRRLVQKNASEADAAHFKRHIMPPSLASLSPSKT